MIEKSKKKSNLEENLGFTCGLIGGVSSTLLSFNPIHDKYLEFMLERYDGTTNLDAVLTSANVVGTSALASMAIGGMISYGIKKFYDFLGEEN